MLFLVGRHGSGKSTIGAALADILVGEIRGPDVAVAALEASITGHMVWTTLHIPDPFVFVERLELMDRIRLDRKVFSDHKIVRGVIAQRLLPKLCQHCSIPLSNAASAISERIVSALQTWGNLTKVRVKGPGCSHCSHDGTSGRFTIAEVVVTDAKLMKDFIEHGSETARANYRARPEADPSMLESAISYVMSGLVDPRAVEKKVDLIEIKSQERKQ
jgi:general secretion pathway protein E